MTQSSAEVFVSCLVFGLAAAIALRSQDAVRDATGESQAATAAQAESAAQLKTGSAGDAADAWRRFKQVLDQKGADERARLSTLLEPKLADLALDYKNRDNRDYLEREFDQIAKLDPDVVAVLLPMLSPKNDEGGSKNRADNAKRVLARFDLRAYGETLLRLAKDAPSVHGRLRALWLLARSGNRAAISILDAALKDLPEVYVPDLLMAIGETRNKVFADKLLPFLSRPSEGQRLAALGALAQIGAPSTIAAATKAAVELASDQSYSLLLDLLGATREGLGEKDRVSFALALVETLKRAENLEKPDAMRAARFTSELGNDGLGAAAGVLEGALLGMVEHPSTDVQFLAARILQDRGDKRAVKKILDRLDEFVKNNKKVPYAWHQRALAQQAFGNGKAAIKDVAQAIKLTPTADPRLHILAAELEVERKAATGVLRHLKAAEATPEELRRFRAAHPDIEDLIMRNSQLRKLFED